MKIVIGQLIHGKFMLESNFSAFYGIMFQFTSVTSFPAYMGTGGMVGGGTTPLKTKILANHTPYDVGPRTQGGGKFLAAEGGRKFFPPPWGAIFSKITTPVKKY